MVAGCGPCEWRAGGAQGRFRFTGLTMTRRLFTPPGAQRCLVPRSLAVTIRIAPACPDALFESESRSGPKDVSVPLHRGVVLDSARTTAPLIPVGGELSALSGAQR
jgi:hypothetical protein